MSETLIFDAMTSRVCVNIPINPDSDLEGSENFTVTLTTPDANVVLNPEEGVVVITDTSGTLILYQTLQE